VLCRVVQLPGLCNSYPYPWVLCRVVNCFSDIYSIAVFVEAFEAGLLRLSKQGTQYVSLMFLTASDPRHWPMDGRLQVYLQDLLVYSSIIPLKAKHVAMPLKVCLYQWIWAMWLGPSWEMAAFLISLSSMLSWIIAQLPQFISNWRLLSAEAPPPWFLFQWLAVSNHLSCVSIHPTHCHILKTFIFLWFFDPEGLRLRSN